MAPASPVRCPSCGADAELHADGDSFHCRFCGGQVYVDLGRGVRHQRVEPAVRRGQVSAAVGRALTQREVAATPRVTQSELLYVPLWRISDEGRLVQVPGREDLLQEEDLEIGAAEVRVFRREDLDDARALDPEMDLAAARDQAGLAPDGPGDLVHHPVWDVTYVVDGQDVARLRLVETHFIAGNEAAVASGVSEGDRVVIEGKSSIREGTEVRVVGVAGASPRPTSDPPGPSVDDAVDPADRS